MKIRKTVTERYCRFLTGQPVDRIPDIEFGYWPQTVRRWMKEGLPRSLDEWWYSERERIGEKVAFTLSFNTLIYVGQNASFS
jgi:hypothetical protein